MRHGALVLALAIGGSLAAQGSAPPSAPSALWALQPLRGSAITAPTQIDQWIDRRLAANGLHRSPRADRRTLLRRAAFALTGLPPKPDDMAAFLADAAPDAFARAIDRLLASPQFGEHQARAWLDLARYSDSNGLDENLAFGTAWRYRDWVVRAFNQDLPYDRFGTMQLAGDLMPTTAEAERQDGLVATAFLALGPKMLAEQDKDKLVLDTVDEQVDLVGRTFLGLTLGCARCHDHKFDPVPTRDYYALAGIFKSSSVYENLDHVSRWVEQPLASAQALRARAELQQAADAAQREWQEARQELLAAQPARLIDRTGRLLLAGRELAQHAIAVEAEAASATSLGRDDSHWGSKDCVILHTIAGGPQFAEYPFEVATAGSYRLDLRMASKESRPLRVRLDGEPQIESCAAATTGDWFPANQQWVLAGELRLAAGRHTLRLEGLGASMPHLDRWLLTPASTTRLPADLPLALVRRAALLLGDANGEIGRQFAALAMPDTQALAQVFGNLPPPASAAELAARWQLQWQTVWQAWSELQAEARQQKREAPKALPTPSLERLRQTLLGPNGLLALDETELLATLPPADAERLARLTGHRDRTKAAVPPAPATAMCIREDKPIDVPIHIRGNPQAPAKEPVPRGMLSALATAVPFPELPKDQSGRLQLARWLFDARNPLTARVAANRVWLVLFGEGLSRSPSNFGVRGDVPSHPELLDGLALSLQQDGWSIQRLMRRILLSETWQQQSLAQGSGAADDPGNRLLWRQHRRRLSAEAIRDAMLAVAGNLDLTMGGTLLGTGDRDYVTNDQSGNAARYDAPRRSIYLPIIRNAMFDWFAAFDYADPSVHLEQRPASAVAPQALLLMNSPFVLAQAKTLAEAVQRQGGSEDDALTSLWQRTLQRQPREDERSAARGYLHADAKPTAQAWQSLSQALLCTNEFVYVD